MLTFVCNMKPYIQPFERKLAIAELRALANSEPVPVDGDPDTAMRFRVESSKGAKSLRAQLAYWETIGHPQPELTKQLLHEASWVASRNGLALEKIPTLIPQIAHKKLPNKRCLRYATHGLHEYRGKFFPQLVRSLANLANVPPDGAIFDPMCGSGTTLVEGIISGRRTYGLDLNPLSVFATEVKCEALFLSPKLLINSYRKLMSRVLVPAPKLNGASYFFSLSETDQAYLERWFSASILAELDHIRRAILEFPEVSVQRFFLLCLSNILRSVSWQKQDDLRVRREVRHFPRAEAVASFLDAALRSTKSVVAFNTLRGSRKLGRHSIREHDARNPKMAFPRMAGKMDVIITSPPYATALPYLDTDRLSLIYAGLLPRQMHRSRDTIMIGNREISEKGRQREWSFYEENRDLLPRQTKALVERIHRLNGESDVGFRRRNLSALLAKYFLDMRTVFGAQREMLRPGGTMFVVIGNNRTVAGNEEVEIRTADHLIGIGDAVGLRPTGRLPMEMLVSRDIFRRNAMASEEILTFERHS